MEKYDASKKKTSKGPFSHPMAVKVGDSHPMGSPASLLDVLIETQGFVQVKQQGSGDNPKPKLGGDPGSS